MLAPDLIAITRPKPLSEMGHDPVEDAPGLAGEVIDGPSDAGVDYADRARRFLAMGVGTVWVVRPESRAVDVYRPGRAAEAHQGNDRLTADGLPGFACTAADLFRFPGDEYSAGEEGTA